jgi:hypothetical protein
MRAIDIAHSVISDLEQKISNWIPGYRDTFCLKAAIS